MTRPEQIVLVSDLHLGAGDRDDPFRRDGDFVALCDHLAATRPGPPGARRLAVLGDFLELLGVRAGKEPRLASSTLIALGRLGRIVRAHPVVFSALADLVAAGWDLDLVAGNHDVDLLRPELRHRLTELLCRGGGAGGRVRFHPWILHVPGVLYAEHGNQYHDVNWFPELAWAAGRRGDQPVRHPVAAHLGVQGPTLAAAVLRDAGARLLGARDPRRRTYRREALPALAVATGLGAGALRRIDLLPATSTLASARRMALRRRLALRATAAEIHRVLRDEGADCAVYAFGHSHVAERVPLAGDGGPVYVNPGTWCRDVRGRLQHAADHEQATFAVVDCPAGTTPAVALRSWRRQEEVAATDRR